MEFVSKVVPFLQEVPNLQKSTSTRHARVLSRRDLICGTHQRIEDLGFSKTNTIFFLTQIRRTLITKLRRVFPSPSFEAFAPVSPSNPQGCWLDLKATGP